MKEDLLIELTRLSECNYISDLSLHSKTLITSDILDQIPNDVYPLSEWLDAISYMAHTPVSFSSEKEARLYLLDFISN